MINSKHKNIITLDLVDEKASEQFAARLAAALSRLLIPATESAVQVDTERKIGGTRKSLDDSSSVATKQSSSAVAVVKTFSAPLVVALSGDIGAGKTTIIRAMLKCLGVQSAIKSPTFSLVESYTCNNLTIHHFDLYRIHHEDELEYLGFRDYFSNQSICFIEWAEHAGKSLPQVDIHFNLSIKGAGREMQIQALSVAGKSILDLVVLYGR